MSSNDLDQAPQSKYMEPPLSGWVGTFQGAAFYTGKAVLRDAGFSAQVAFSISIASMAAIENAHEH